MATNARRGRQWLTEIALWELADLRTTTNILILPNAGWPKASSFSHVNKHHLETSGFGHYGLQQWHQWEKSAAFSSSSGFWDQPSLEIWCTDFHYTTCRYDLDRLQSTSGCGFRSLASLGFLRPAPMVLNMRFWLPRCSNHACGHDEQMLCQDLFCQHNVEGLGDKFQAAVRNSPFFKR